MVSVVAVEQHSTWEELRATGQLRADALHFDTAALLKKAERFGGLTSKVTVEDARRRLQLMMPLLTSHEDVASVETRLIPTGRGSIRIRVVTPLKGEGPRPAILWFHGGGFVLGDLVTAEPTARSLAVRTGAIVIAVNYRKAPEHRLDDAYDDALAALRWAMSNANSLGIDPSRVAVGGDSAGGNIAAVLAQEYVPADDAHKLAAQLLVYPAVAASDQHFPSRAENADGNGLDLKAIRWFEWHIAGATDPDSDRYAPLNTPDLSNLPPTVIVSVGYDPLRDEAIAYHDRIRQAGVSSTLLHYSDDVHGFFTMDAMLENGRLALDEVGEAIADLFGTPEEYRGAAGTSFVDDVTAPIRNRVRTYAAWAVFVGDRVLTGQTRYQRRMLRFLGLPAGREVEAIGAQVERMEQQLRTLRQQLEQANHANERPAGKAKKASA
ncbi:MAG: hypothetical protein JWM76_3081 [Pseudonocardiales bacterium]|nr:hypothetical protein [Pseudonocardiales bacterium]